MSIVVPDDLRSFVEREIASGKYRSEDEVISAGLRLLREREEKTDALRADLLDGALDLDDGHGRPAAKVFRELKERAAELAERT